MTRRQKWTFNHLVSIDHRRFFLVTITGRMLALPSCMILSCRPRRLIDCLVHLLTLL